MMKRFIIGAMLILGLCSWVKAQKIDVRIRVVDEWNRPLQGVMMRIGGMMTSRSFRTKTV